MVELLGHARAGGPVFTLNGKKPYAGHQLLKAFLDRESGVAGWTYHDIRRTVASGLAALQVPQDTIDRVLNHSKGRSPEPITATVILTRSGERSKPGPITSRSSLARRMMGQM